MKSKLTPKRRFPHYNTRRKPYFKCKTKNKVIRDIRSNTNSILMPIIHQKKMVEIKLQGSGGYVIAELTDEQAKKADLGVGKLFLAPVGKLEAEKMSKHYCNNCEAEFDNPPKIQLEENTNEEVADNLILVERGQYTCEKCNSIIGEYRVFKKNDESSEVGKAKPSE
jgi:hypothetical protein